MSTKSWAGAGLKVLKTRAENWFVVRLIKGRMVMGGGVTRFGRRFVCYGVRSNGEHEEINRRDFSPEW